MYVADDPVLAEVLHRVRQQIPADGLDDVFDEFRAVAFEAFPFFRGAGSFVGDALSAVFVDFDLRIRIGSV